MQRNLPHATLALALAAALAPARAADVVQALRVDAAPLPRCLEQIAAGTGARFILSPRLAQDAPRCRPVVGATSAAMALDAALADSDVAWRMRDDGVFLLAASAPVAAGTLDTLAIEDTALEGGDADPDAGGAAPHAPRTAFGKHAGGTQYDRAELAAMPLVRFNQVGRLAPNVYSSGQSLSIRGVPRDNDYFTGNGVTIDGIDVGTLLLDHNLLPVDDLAAVRYVRSGAAFEYGGGRAGGSIQIDTPAPEPRFGARLAVGGGERSSTSAVVAADAPLLADGSLSGRLTLGRRNDPRFVRSAVVASIDDDTDRRDNANLRLRWEPESLPGLSVDLTGFHVDADAPDRSVARPGVGVPFDLFDRVSFDRSAIDYDLRGTGRGLRADYATAGGVWMGAWASDLDATREGLALRQPDRVSFRRDDEARANIGLGTGLALGEAWRLHASIEQQRIERSESFVQVVGATPAQGVAYTGTNRNILDLDNTAVVAELSWREGPWRVSAGMRHVDETVEFRYRELFVPTIGAASDRITQRTRSDYRRNLPAASIEYELTPTQAVGASYSRGYRSGGFSEFVVVGEYAPESLATTELSWRGAWFEQRLGLRAALFRTAWRDRTSIDGTIGAEIIEPFETRIDGAELELEATLSESIALRGGLGWLDARHRSGRYALAFREFDLAGVRATDAPGHTVLLGAIWRGAGGWSASVDAYRAGAAQSSTFSRDAVGSEVPLPRAAYTVVDARIGWQGDRLGVALTASNLFDEEYIDRYVERRAFSRILGEPRQVDLRVTWTW
jgi:outer membrane receptor protein involved in Fe transport